MNDFISIVILQYNNSHYTKDLLRSLSNVDYKNFRTIYNVTLNGLINRI